MDAGEPHARRRGMFVQAETPELDAMETESAEGMPVRIARRKRTLAARPGSALPPDAIPNASKHQHQIRRPFRFANETGSRRLLPMHR
jgi:hypothetical protein